MEENKKNKEIDIIGLTKKILQKWTTLLIFIGCFGILGVIIALCTPKSYTTSVILAPEMSSGGMGMSESLADMASSFGIDIGSKSAVDAIYPEIYPDVISSSDFILSLFEVPVHLKEDPKPRTYQYHLIKDVKSPFWNKPKEWIINLLKKKEPAKGSNYKINPIQLSPSEEELCNAVRGAIACQVDKKTSVITISAKDQDPMVATIIADTVREKLQDYITSYKTKKARADLNYYQKLYRESREDYIKAQQLYASYSDANEDVILLSFKAKQEQLENEMQMKYNTYQQMAVQLQNAKAKVQASTPAFTVIQRATMPNKASSTPRALVVAFFILLGIIFDALWILYIQPALEQRRQQKK